MRKLLSVLFITVLVSFVASSQCTPGTITTNSTSTCGGSDGSIFLPDINGTLIYSVFYDINGTNTPATFTVNSSGMTITNLSAGTYTNIQINYNNGACTAGISGPFTIANPVPTVNAVANQTVNAGNSTTAVAFAGSSSDAVYSWTNSNTAIGLGASGRGNLPAFTATNTGSSPITSTITVTPIITSGFAYVANRGSNTVSVIKTATNTVSTSVPVNTPKGAVASPDGTKVYVASGDNAVAVITTATNTVSATIALPAGSDPFGIAISPDGTKVYVSNVNSNAVSVINTATNIVSATIAVGSGPYNVAVSPDGSKVYVANVGGSQISAINTANNAVIAITVGSAPRGVVFSPDGSKAYVANGASNTISVVNTATNLVSATITLGAEAIPFGISISPDGSKVYLANIGNNSVAVINTATNTVSATIPVGATPSEVAVSSDGTRVYVSNQGSANVSVINTRTNTVTNTITVGTTPIGIAYIPASACSGTPQTFTITVNPTPTVNAIANQTICNGASTAAITFSGAVSGTVYNWTNSNPAIGLLSSGSGNIAAFTGINTGTVPVAATITVTPSYTNNGVTATGTPQTFTITVNPTPTVNAVAAQTICNGSNTTALTFSGAIAGTVYSWTNSNTAIGLGASGSGNIASFAATNTTSAPVISTITVTPSYTANGVTCTGSVSSFTITVNPTPTVAAIANQTVCNGAATTAVAFTGAVSGTTYTWVNSNPAIGLVASGSGNIASFTATNTGNAPQVATITVTPSYTNGGVACTGTSQTFTMTVNPTPTVNTVSAQTVCNGGSATGIAFNGSVTGTVYNWTNNTPGIGLAASGTGNIAAFTATNTGATPVTATITVTPSYSNGGVTCSGTAQTFTISVNPTPTADAVSNQAVCNGATSTAIAFAGPTTGTVYNWTNNNPAIGLAASGSGNIPAFTAVNTGSAPVIATITVTPSYTNNSVACTGTARTFTITVNPTPSVNTTANATYCAGSTGAAINFAGPVSGTTYSWTSSANVGFGTSGTGTIAGFTAANAGATPVVATVTVTPSANGCTGSAQTFTITVNNCATAVPNLNTDVSSVMLMPNLVHQSTTLKVLVRRTMKIDWNVSDANGRIVLRFNQQVAAGQANLFNLSTAKLASGTYYLTGFTADGQTSTVRFIKR